MYGMRVLEYPEGSPYPDVCDPMCPISTMPQSTIMPPMRIPPSDPCSPELGNCSVVQYQNVGCRQIFWPE